MPFESGMIVDLCLALTNRSLYNVYVYTIQRREEGDMGGRVKGWGGKRRGI